MNNKVEGLVNNIKGRQYAGSSTRDSKMYHDLPFEGLDSFISHRGRTRERINLIKSHLSFKDKTVLDIGCSVGGISLGIAEAGAKHVTGVDYAKDSIEIAQEASESLKIDDITTFKVEDITIEWAKALPKYDVIIWLSQWMWIVKQQGMEYAQELLFEVSKKADYMFFESSADDGMARIKGSTQDDIQIWLKQFTVFRKLRRYNPVGGWMHRDLFLMLLPLVKLESGKRATTSTIERMDAFTIKKTFLLDWEWQLEREIEAYKRLEKFDHYPKVHSFNKDERSITMDYAGACEWLDFHSYQDQALEILEELRSVGIEHRDFRHGNFLELNDKLYLIDFGWAIFDDEEDSPIPAARSMNWRRGIKDEEKLRAMFKINQ